MTRSELRALRAEIRRVESLLEALDTSLPDAGYVPHQLLGALAALRWALDPGRLLPPSVSTAAAVDRSCDVPEVAEWLHYALQEMGSGPDFVRLPGYCPDCGRPTGECREEPGEPPPGPRLHGGEAGQN